MFKELKTCPYCGCEAKVIKIPDGLSWAGLYVVGCDDDSTCMGNINHFTMVFSTPESATEAWNKRAKEHSLQPIDQEVIGIHLLGHCPVCGNGLNASMKHCDQCGQKLDWRAI